MKKQDTYGEKIFGKTSILERTCIQNVQRTLKIQQQDKKTGQIAE